MAKTRFLHDFNKILARFTSNIFRLGMEKSFSSMIPDIHAHVPQVRRLRELVSLVLYAFVYA